MIRRKPNWAEVKAAYLADQGSMRELAERFGVSFSSLGKRALREHWTQERHNIEDSVVTAATKTATEQGERIGMDAAALVKRSIRELEAWLDRIDVMAKAGQLTPDSLAKMISAWRSVVELGRTTLGLTADAPVDAKWRGALVASRIEIRRIPAEIDVPGDAEIIDVNPGPLRLPE